MKLATPKTVSAERLSGGVHIAFSNGDEGFYSDELLYASLSDAQRLLAEALQQSDGSEPPR